MATNKHALIRYQALDRCFSNWGRNFYINDLIKACNEALYNHTGEDKYSDPDNPAISRRQIYDDIGFMESSAGWEIPLEHIKDGKKVYFRYSDKNFTINNQPLSKAELDQLKEATFTLSRFKGVPSFEWIEEIISKLEDKFQLVGNTTSVIDFEQNIYLKGLEFLSPIFSSIVNRQCLQITYCKFEGEVLKWSVHPYYIKQYNTRWFLFALNDEYQSITNIPLDRIVNCTPIDLRYKATDIDFTEYFDDVIGVTIPREAVVENIVLKFSINRFPYVTSKPLHWSQKIIDKENCIIEISVIPNKELYSLLLSYGSDVEVLEPQTLREGVAKDILEQYKKYFSCAD
jgi:predicted DNA-binding transcriptional regulator YafY